MPLFPQLAMRYILRFLKRYLWRLMTTQDLRVSDRPPMSRSHLPWHQQLGFVITATHVQNTDLHEDDLWAELRINEVFPDLLPSQILTTGTRLSYR